MTRETGGEVLGGEDEAVWRRSNFEGEGTEGKWLGDGGDTDIRRGARASTDHRQLGHRRGYPATSSYDQGRQRHQLSIKHGRMTRERERERDVYFLRSALRLTLFSLGFTLGFFSSCVCARVRVRVKNNVYSSTTFS